MTYAQLKEYLMKFYGDTSRSREETKDKLEDLRAELDLLIDSLED